MNALIWESIDRIPGFMSRAECEWLAATAGRAQSWTELGAFCGRSMLCVGLHLPQGGRLQVVDLSLGVIMRAGQTLYTTLAELQQRRPDLEIILYRGESTRAASRLPGSDVVFVDAGHSYEHASADIAAWRPKCRELCGHDYNPTDWPGVVRAVHELLPEFSNPAGSIWTFKGKAAGPPDEAQTSEPAAFAA